MVRRKQSLIELTAQLPCWVSLLLGLGLYGFLAHVVPLTLSDPMQRLEPAFTVLGYVLASACGMGALLGLAVRWKQQWLYRSQHTLDQIHALSWADFEHLMAEAFRREGYAASLTDSGADGGVDIRLTKDGTLTLVQCKHWRTRRVGVGPIRELAGIVAAEGATGGIFVCSGSYTPEAEAFAARAGMRLIDERSLAGMLKFDSELEQRVSRESHACPECGGKLVRRVARRGRHAGSAFLGCSAFPKCRYTLALEIEAE